MLKKLAVVALCVYNLSVFACPRALPTNDPNFCASFKIAGTCYCTDTGLPSGMCQDMGLLYRRMLSVFGSLQKACEYQTHTSTQDCMDNWNCYLQGGIDSTGKWCSGTKQACV